MHAYLLIGNKESLKKKTIADLCDKGSQKLSYSLQNISDVRKLHGLTKLALKQKTAIVIDAFDQTTEAAQNAFLKELEEPQPNLTYILIANRAEGILPTIHSRCQIIELGQKQPLNRDIQTFQNFYQAKPAERLLITSKIKTRDQAYNFLGRLISGGSAEIPTNPMAAHTLCRAIKALKALEQNGNVQLQLTSFVIGI